MSGIQFFGASVRGTSHVKNDLPCHDSHLIRRIQEDEGIIAALSDGMGSAKHAEIGSALASEAAVDYLEEHLKPEDSDDTILDTLKACYREVHSRLAQEAIISEYDIKDLNATLMMFIHLKDGRQFTGQVGDCVTIGQAEGEEAYHVIIQPQKGEYANQTFSICTKSSIENGDYLKLENPQSKVAMMSDGVESISINASNDDVSKLFFDPFFNAFDKPSFDSDKVSASLQRFLDSDRINKRTDDDKTLLFIRLE